MIFRKIDLAKINKIAPAAQIDELATRGPGCSVAMGAI
jgi:hypothetical protein